MNYETIAAMSLGNNLVYMGLSVALMTTALLWCYTPASKPLEKEEANKLLMKQVFPGVFIDRSEWRAARRDLLRLEELEAQAAERRTGELYPTLSILVLAAVYASIGAQWFSMGLFGLFALTLLAGAFDNLYFSLMKREARRLAIQ